MKNTHHILITLCFLIMFAFCSYAQKLSPGPQVLTIFSDADDTEQPYGLYIPQHYDPNKKYPLVIMLHGAGSNHRLSLRRVFGKSNFNEETDVEATRYFPEWKDVDYIVASPYARGTAGYQGIQEQDVWDVVADVKKRFNIDEERTYLTGLSMGGGGTLWIGLTRPDVWAAIAPVCPAPPKGTDLLLPNAFNVPSHFFHGDIDQAVPVAVSREWTKKLKDLGANVEYTEYPGVNHNSWENAYKDEFIFDWFSKFKRNRFPDRVLFNSNKYKYNTAYWVKFDQLTPGTLATIDAKFIDANKLEITTGGLGAFTLNLAGHPKYKPGQLQITINGKKLKVQGGESVSLSQQDGKWIQKKLELLPTAKRAMAEGPIEDAFGSRHIYVYGTSGNPSEAEIKARMDIATQAANWSFYRNAFLGRIMFFPRIVADKDVRASDYETCNMILFGTKETNSVIQKYSDRLPMELNASAVSSHGLAFIFPVDKHYVVVNSGLAWWTGSDEQNYRFPPAYNEVPNFKDFVLFNETVKNKIVEGYFDENWKVKSNDAASLNGIVTVKQ
jgi:predicted esterase